MVFEFYNVYTIKCILIMPIKAALIAHLFPSLAMDNIRPTPGLEVCTEVMML